MIQVRLYSRKECHLCDQARSDLESLRAIIPHHLEIIDIDTSPALQREYGLDIPVVEAGVYRLRSPFSIDELKMTLAAARDRERHIDMIEHSPALEEARRVGGWSGADRFTFWISKHYLALFNLFVILYLGGAFLAPVLMKAGAEKPASVIYRAYSLVCHQLSYRSIFLFGEQWFYPRAAAGVKGLQTYAQASGNGEGSDAIDLYTARIFPGNERMGYKVALCERDVAIYGGILMFGLLFGLLQMRLPAIPWYLWILFGILPIAIDGVSQLISQPPFSFIPFRESTPGLRILTGWLFGFFTAWFGYPMVEETMAETRQIMGSKWQRIQRLVARQ
jgi:uncharacterized membrane protein